MLYIVAEEGKVLLFDFIWSKLTYVDRYLFSIAVSNSQVFFAMLSSNLMALLVHYVCFTYIQ